MENISNILQFVASVKSKYNEIAKITGENYNMFHLLDIGHLENYHSKIIADLLNPKGLHSQGNIFLKLFLDNFLDVKIKINEIEVFTEYVIDNQRRIDIYLKDNENQNIIIENKIYASEQQNQLSDYQNFGKKQNENSKLFFLTLDGHESIENDKLNYTCISYQSDIIKWLELCKKETTNFPILRETLTQYIFLLKSLTNQNPNQKMANEITEFLTKDAERLKDFFQVSDSYNHVINSLINDFNAQMQSLADELKVTYESNLSGKIYETFSFCIINEDSKKFDLTFQFHRKDYSELGFGITASIESNKHGEYFTKNYDLYLEIDNNFREVFKYCKSLMNDLRYNWLNFGYVQKYNNWYANNHQGFLAIKTGEMKDYIKNILLDSIRIVTETINKK